MLLANNKRKLTQTCAIVTWLISPRAEAFISFKVVSSVYCNTFSSLIKNTSFFDLNIFYFIYMKRDWAEQHLFLCDMLYQSFSTVNFTSCWLHQTSLLQSHKFFLPWPLFSIVHNIYYTLILLLFTGCVSTEKSNSQMLHSLLSYRYIYPFPIHIT